MDTPITNAVVHDRCPPPKRVNETEIELNSLLRLLMKTFYVRGIETASQAAFSLKLPLSVVNELLDEAKDRNLVEVLGAAGLRLSAEFRYGISDQGRQWARDALDQSLYVGPAPVSLADFHRQIARQKVTEEQVSREALKAGLSQLVISDAMVRTLGPAINASRSILLYGSAGNGKTTIAEIIGGLFQDVVHIPYCIEIDGQIIKVFDPTLHKPVEDLEQDFTGMSSEEVSLRTEDIDHRWVACKRPLVISGGELTLPMLDLRFNPYSRFYEAPLHMKAISGTFVIDDLGRQLVRPEDLLNRWIGPMESRVDYLSLTTGKSFQIPFDVLLTFSTNLLPEDIMDPAFLRRIPYKIGVPAPTPKQYLETLEMVFGDFGLTYNDELGNYIMKEVTDTFEQPLAFFQPKFLAGQLVEMCKFDGRSLSPDKELIHEACLHLAPRSKDLGMVQTYFPWQKARVEANQGPTYTPLDR
ncbi:MAG: hypothetical protein R3245_03300 [Kiloniellales bacterium]|nr:hypothetical protein [Kiloniellales bacterium]